ncbi:hypothetical protein IU448_25595 [Nocardia flavorosea]|uniref:hypothetical protein n=2 Tax=Nocardia TaxID=1817 RepID=UPI0018946837|nr:hypothetical protein [Nocardia flavorosea]
MPETATDPLILAAEQADAEAAAAEAEALAAQASATAARARARAAKLRREAEEQRGAGSPPGFDTAGSDAVPGDFGASSTADAGETGEVTDPGDTTHIGDAGAAPTAAVAGDSGMTGSAGTEPPSRETATSGAASALLSKSPHSEFAAAQADTASNATAQRDADTSTGPTVDTSKKAGAEDGDPAGPDSSGDMSRGADSAGLRATRPGSGIDRSDDAGSDVDTAAGFDASDGGSKQATSDREFGAGTAMTKRLPAGPSKFAGRFRAAARRVGTSTTRWPSRRGIARALVALIVLAALVTGGYSIWNHQQIAADQAREDEFLNAAREGVIALTTLDSGNAADDVKRVLDHSTGAFRTDFQTRSEDFIKVVEQSKVATQGEITAVAVESMTDESAVVLVSAVSRVTNTAGAQQEPRVWRLSVTVTREDSQLKMSKVEFVP